jgi:hypothetical protein
MITKKEKELQVLLFLDDWQNYPDAIIDLDTKNKSFVRISALYKEMGIKNHAFPLALLNPELKNVDPFDPNLQIDQMAMIAIECKQNFMYFLREIVRIPGSTIEMPIYFRANRANIALAWLFYNHITTILIQPRQTGKSLTSDLIMTAMLNIVCTMTQINLLTKDETLRSANLERLKNIEHELPFYLKQRGRGDIGNTEELSVKSLGNTYRGHLPNRSPKLALNVGRGLTSPIFQIDEAAFFFNIAISMPAALAAGTAARDKAIMKNEPYGTILTTTAGKKDDVDGSYVYNLLINSAVWSERFLDAENHKELEQLIRRNSPKGELRVNCTFNHRQLGYTDDWMRRALEDSNSQGEAADRDFFNIWTSGSVLSPLPVDVAKIIRESESDKYYDEIAIQGYITRWYLPTNEITSYMARYDTVLSIDSSDAAGGDDIAAIRRNIKTGEVIAAGNYNETNLIVFCEWLFSEMMRFPKMTLIIERRSTGAMIIDYLLLMFVSKGVNPFKRIYNKVVQEADEFPDRFKEINKADYLISQELVTKYKKTFGFATSATGATSRTELYSTTLLSSAKVTGNKVKDKRTIDQILGLIIKNGRVDHPPGEHDDLAITWLLGYWLLTLGKNLHFYGINSRDILSENIINIQNNKPLDVFERNEQQYLRTQIENLIEEIKSEKDEYIASNLENKLRMLANRLNDSDKAILSVDELINNLKDFRYNNRRANIRYY